MRYESMMIGIERHSEIQVLRSAKGEKQGNAVTVSQVIVSALECFFPPQLCKSNFWTGSRKLQILQAKRQKRAMYTQDKGWVS